MCIWRYNQQFFTHKTAFGAVCQIVENWLFRFDKSTFNIVNIQRPDWISGSFLPTFKFTRFVQIPNIYKRGELFFVQTNRSQIFGCGFRNYNLFFYSSRGFHTDQPSDLFVQSRNNFGQSFDPLSRAQTLRRTHFNRILVPKQTLSQGAVKTFNDSLVSVNFGAATSDRSFVFFHFLS